MNDPESSSSVGEADADADAGFQLTHVLRGHTSDVRSVAAMFERLSGREALLSGSRDETASYWSRPLSNPSDAPQSSFEKGTTFQGKRFCNAIAFVQPASPFGLPHGQILMGSLDSQIRCFDPLRPDKPLQVLSDHWDNISVLKPYNSVPKQGRKQERQKEQEQEQEQEYQPVFISGSWDKTARVWLWDPADSGGKWSSKFVLRGHDEAVWGVQIVEPPSLAALHASDEQLPPTSAEGRYLTSSADLFIRLFHGEQLHAVYAGHMDVVRSLELLPVMPSQDHDAEFAAAATDSKKPPLYAEEELFASTSNDGTIRVWSLDPRRSPTSGNGGDALRVLKGHTSLVYDLAAYCEHGTRAPRLISSGEDGTFRVWDWVSGELLQTVAVPVISVWSTAVLPVSQDVIVGCSDGLVRVYSRHIASTSPSENSDFTGPPLSSAEASLEAEKAKDVRERHALAVQAKENPSGIGETTEAETDGEVYQGQRYDFVLRVDVADDAEPLLLPINRRDDRDQVASDFVALHQLPESYVDKIVEFVNLVLG